MIMMEIRQESLLQQMKMDILTYIQVMTMDMMMTMTIIIMDTVITEMVIVGIIIEMVKNIGQIIDHLEVDVLEDIMMDI